MSAIYHVFIIITNDIVLENEVEHCITVIDGSNTTYGTTNSFPIID